MFRILLACFFPLLLSAQQHQTATQRNELSLCSENDAYLLQYHDAYYSNGIFLEFTRANIHGQQKRLQGLELAQTIYTPVNRNAETIKAIDRPYCGYVSLKYQQTDFLPKNALLKWWTSIGILGDNSGAEALQNQYHTLFGYKKFSGWAYQVPNAVTINAGIQYAKTIWQPRDDFKLIPIAKAGLGTGFINAGAGAYFCFGLFEQNQSSALWNARVSKETTGFKNNVEFFLYALPEWTYQNYNATLQGDRFFSQPSTVAVLAQPIGIVFQQTVGVCYAENRITGKAAWVYQSRETNSQIGNQQYLSFQINYRF
jgi:hypothetical protein